MSAKSTEAAKELAPVAVTSDGKTTGTSPKDAKGSPVCTAGARVRVESGESVEEVETGTQFNAFATFDTSDAFAPPPLKDGPVSL